MLVVFFLVLFLQALGSLFDFILADGFHLPNFYEKTVRDSWEKIKKDFNYPALEAGKSWSDFYQLIPVDPQVRPYKALRKGTPQDLMLKTAIVKMIAILKYTDPYNYAYDSPPWMRRAETREQGVKEAEEILGEIGYQALPYLWEALESQWRFAFHVHLDRIQNFRQTQFAFSQAQEGLREALRGRDPKMIEYEAELEVEVERFWKSDSLIGSVAGRASVRYDFLLNQLDRLKRTWEGKDKEIKRLSEELKKAELALKNARGRMPGEYFTVHGGEFRVCDDATPRLCRAILRYGNYTKIFLKNQLASPSPIVAQEAKKILEGFEKEEKEKGKKTPEPAPKSPPAPTVPPPPTPPAAKDPPPSPKTKPLVPDFFEDPQKPASDPQKNGK